MRVANGSGGHPADGRIAVSAPANNIGLLLKDAAIAEAFHGRDCYDVRRKIVGRLDKSAKLGESLLKIGV